MKLRKEITVIAFVLVLLMTNTVFGATPLEMDQKGEYVEIGTRFSSIHDIQCALKVNSSDVDVDVLLHASTGNKTRIVAYLQKNDNGSWKTVETLTNTSSDIFCAIDEKVSTSTNYEFRVKVYAYVYDGNTLLEKATMYAY